MWSAHTRGQMPVADQLMAAVLGRLACRMRRFRSAAHQLQADWEWSCGGKVDPVGEAKSKRRAHEAILKKYPWCIYCGGVHPADTIDHMPPIAMFEGRQGRKD
jgi:hypothetical protein